MPEKSARYTVKQLADLARISVRTLHYYDEIGLLRPAEVRSNGYRYYDDASLYRLQQILLYREMDVKLEKIRSILDAPDFELVPALQAHRKRLTDRRKRLNTLIQTLDATILGLVGEIKMSKENIFKGFTEEEEKKYTREARKRWGPGVDKSIKLWNSYSEEKKKAIMEEAGRNYRDIVENMPKGPHSPEVQEIIVRWHNHLRYFYEPTFEILRGLGNGYHDDPGFNANFTKVHPDLPAFLQQAINYYVDQLEEA